MEQANRLPPMYAAIILTGIMGFILNTIYYTLEHKVVFWTPAAREQTTCRLLEEAFQPRQLLGLYPAP